MDPEGTTAGVLLESRFPFLGAETCNPKTHRYPVPHAHSPFTPLLRLLRLLRLLSPASPRLIPRMFPHVVPTGVRESRSVWKDKKRGFLTRFRSYLSNLNTNRWILILGSCACWALMLSISFKGGSCYCAHKPPPKGKDRLSGLGFLPPPQCISNGLRMLKKMRNFFTPYFSVF